MCITCVPCLSDPYFFYSFLRQCSTPSHMVVIIYLMRCDSITVSSTWELTSVYMRYSQGDGVNTSLSKLMYCTHVSCLVLVYKSLC